MEDGIDHDCWVNLRSIKKDGIDQGRHLASSEEEKGGKVE